MKSFEENFTININLDKLVNKSNFLKKKSFNIEGNDQIRFELIGNIIVKIYKYCVGNNKKVFESCSYYKMSELTIVNNQLILPIDKNFPSENNIKSGFVAIGCILFNNGQLSEIFNSKSTSEVKEGIASLLNKISPKNYIEIYNLIDNKLFLDNEIQNKSEVFKNIFRAINSGVRQKYYYFTPKQENLSIDETGLAGPDNVEKTTGIKKSKSKIQNTPRLISSKKSFNIDNKEILDYEKVDFGESDYTYFNSCFNIGSNNNIIIKRKTRGNLCFFKIDKDYFLNEILDGIKDYKIKIDYHINLGFRKDNKTIIQQDSRDSFLVNNLPFKTNKNFLEVYIKGQNFYLTDDYYNTVRQKISPNSNKLVIDKIIQRFCITIKTKNTSKKVIFQNYISPDSFTKAKNKIESNEKLNIHISSNKLFFSNPDIYIES